MNDWSKKIVTLIAGNPDEFDLEHRNLNIACFVFSGIGIPVITFNFFSKFLLLYNIIVSIVILLYMLLYYFSRVKRIAKNSDYVFLALTLSSFSIIWVFSQGIEGSMTLFYIVGAVLMFVTFKTTKYKYITIIFLVNFILLYLLQYFEPSLIVPYPSKNAHLFDLWFSLALCMLVLSYLLSSLKRNYENERIKVENQKIEIESQNQQIQEKNAELEEKQEEVNTQNEKILLQSIQLEEINQNLIASDELKSRFFSNISHEFRTPLTLIISPLESLLEKTNDPALKEEYTQMLKHSRRLLHLINQLLDISKMEKGKMQLELREAEINTLVRTIVASYDSYAKEKGIRFSLQEKARSICLFFDEDKLEKILYNLLSNAFKFTKAGGIIEVALQLSEDSTQVEIIVKDNGIGISPEMQPYIFDRFYQVDGGKSREYEGTGIGLSLTRELASLHKGTIEVSSTKGEGSVFKVSLPMDKAVYEGENVRYKENDKVTKSEYIELPETQHQLPIREDASAGEQSTGLRTVLVVEDNHDMRRHLSRNLGDQFRILEASDGREGIVKALEYQPDLILSDIMMPGIDGLQLTQSIKEHELTSHIPVILLTARAGEENKLEGFGLHADDYITKPFSIKEVKARISAQITNREKLRERFEKTIKVEPSEVTTTSVDEQFLRKVLQVLETNMSSSEFSVDDLCREISMSRTNVHLKLKALTNQSTTEFIRSVRLKRAAQLIRQKAGNTAEIAYMTGFSNQQYFSRCFKEYFKISPSEY